MHTFFFTKLDATTHKKIKKKNSFFGQHVMEDFLLQGLIPIQGVCDIISAYEGVKRRADRINNMLLKGPIPIQGLCDIIGGYQGLEGTRRITLRGHTDWVLCFAVRADGTLASGSSDCTVRVWDLHDGACVQTLVCALAVLPLDQLASGSYDYDTCVGRSKCRMSLDAVRPHSLGFIAQVYALGLVVWVC